jgi:hypothetical protein
MYAEDITLLAGYYYFISPFPGIGKNSIATQWLFADAAGDSL